MKNWKLKQQTVVMEKYGGFLEELSGASSDQMRGMLARLVKDAPLSYHMLLRNRLFRKLASYVFGKTRFLPANARMSTRCWYVINNIDEVICCHNCGKPLPRDIKITEKSKVFWCGPGCQGEDPYMRNQLSKIRTGRKNQKALTKNDIPPECEPVVLSGPIVYDKGMNSKLAGFFAEHRKTIKFWIEKEAGLRQYLFDKTHILDNTELNVETRIKFVLDERQSLPQCSTCGRNIDFINVKMSKDWPKFCCGKCRHAYMSTCGKDWHAEEIYGKMINSKWTHPVFTLEEFKKSNRKTSCFDVKCLKCGGVFKLRFDKNFYVRNGKASYFRCPVCFPFNSSRKTSGDEIELFEYVKGIFSAEDVLRGDRTTIYPYELDIHPAGEHFDFAIEYNGAYWHSIELNNSVNRTLDKVKACEERGIKLVVLWEDDYLNDREFYKKFIFDYVFNTAAVVDKLTNNGTRKNLELDRFVFNKCFSVPGYMLVGETQPATMIRTRSGSSQKWTCPDAGKLIYEKI